MSERINIGLGAWYVRTNRDRLRKMTQDFPLSPNLSIEQRRAALLKIAKEQDLTREENTIDMWRAQIRSSKT